MKYWLCVFFLIGDSWVPGERFDGWGPAAYSSQAQCEVRRQFAEEQSNRYPLKYQTLWVCSNTLPAPLPPPPGLMAEDQH
jgi:hypothetical protein